MSEAARVIEPFALDDDVAEALQICGGNALTALRITLIANAFLEAEIEKLTAAQAVGSCHARLN